MIRSLLLSFLLMWALQAQALTLEGVDVPELLPATKDSPELHMRGASIRRVYGFVEVYVGALYIGDNTLADEQIIDADVARRMTFYVTSSRVSARRFTNAIQDGLSINVSKEKMEERGSSSVTKAVEKDVVQAIESTSVAFEKWKSG